MKRPLYSCGHPVRPYLVKKGDTTAISRYYLWKIVMKSDKCIDCFEKEGTK